MTSATIAPRIEFDLDHTGKPSRTPNHTGHGSHHWTAYALIHARGKTYRANVFQTGPKLATAELESMLYLNGRSIPETHLPDLRAALLEAYRATFAMVAPAPGQSVIIDHAWLRACGKTDWAGKAMEVTRIQPMPAQDEFMIHVINPDGRPWSVWSIRGFEIAQPSPAPIKLKLTDDKAELVRDLTPKTIDCTPTWAALMPALVAMIENGTAKSRGYALEELDRLARFADLHIANAKKGL